PITATATPEIYPLSLHDALPIYRRGRLETAEDDCADRRRQDPTPGTRRELRASEIRAGVGNFGTGQREHHPDRDRSRKAPAVCRSEEHTSELQSRENLVCRLLLE